jgi:hypothetical protein
MNGLALTTSRGYRLPFQQCCDLHIPGEAHGLGTGAIVVMVYLDTTPPQRLGAVQSKVHPVTYDVTLSFGYYEWAPETPDFVWVPLPPQSGTVVLTAA